MNQKRDGIELRKSLRDEAMSMVKNLSPTEPAFQPTEVLLHELLVHKIELEMQIEELRKTHGVIEEARDRYQDLYEFAPSGYITINRDGLISEINLTGAALLGVNRAKLINRHFSAFVAPKDIDRWHRLFFSIIENATAQKQELGLDILRSDGSFFYSHLDCLRKVTLSSPPVLRIALTDISKILQTENN